MNITKSVSKVFFVFLVVAMSPILSYAKDFKQCKAAAMYIDEGNKLLESSPAKAEALYREALKKCPESANVNYNLAVSLYSQEKSSQAVDVLKNVLNTAPDNTDAMRLMAYILVKENIDPARGKALAERMFENNSKDEVAKKILMLALTESIPSTPPSQLDDKPVKKWSMAVASDVDEIPLKKVKQRNNAYAVVVGVEQYRQKLPNVDFAVHDAKTVTEYLTKVMGYPEENVVTLLNNNATKSDLEKYFGKWLSNNVEKDGTVFIYYSGHGAPNPKTGDAFFVPYDGDPTFIDETGYSLKRLYEQLGKLPAKEIVVALDSCFSGAGGRSVLAKGARPLVMNLENQQIMSGKIAVMAAAAGDQISSTYDEKGHGLFTYFMLKGLKGEAETNDSVEIGELFNYIKPQVERIARKSYNNEQSPTLIASKELMKTRLK